MTVGLHDGGKDGSTVALLVGEHIEKQLNAVRPDIGGRGKGTTGNTVDSGLVHVK